jgi:hypothetical protein
MCGLDQHDFDRHDIGSMWCQDDLWYLAMIIGFTIVENKHCWKEIELIYEGKYSNSQIWIWMFVKWFKKIGKWYYWIACSKTRLLQLDSF